MGAKKDKLLQDIALYCVQKGEFKLASGVKSNYYIDLDLISLTPDVKRLPKYIAKMIGDTKYKYVGGLEFGAIPIACAFITSDYFKGFGGFVVRKKAKGGKLIEGIIHKNSECIVFEDVTNTGSSALEAVNKLRDAGHDVTAVISIVDREAGAQELFEKEKIPFVSFTTAKELLKIHETQNSGVENADGK